VESRFRLVPALQGEMGGERGEDFKRYETPKHRSDGYGALIIRPSDAGPLRARDKLRSLYRERGKVIVLHAKLHSKIGTSFEDQP